MDPAAKSSSAILLPTLHRRRSEADIDLPMGTQNLFTRLIRTPYGHERSCAEMLCAVLLNAPRVREGLMAWMVARARINDLPDLGDVEFRINTELPIDGKRDDLRITACDHRSGAVKLVWTIEIKVGAGLHWSTPTAAVTGEGDANDRPQLVNQLVNYDGWLAHQAESGASVAGFVLAPESSLDLPVAELLCRWTCLSWAELGREVERLIASELVPARELEFARHLAGFIRQHMPQETFMTEKPIRFDDLALLRAYANFGDETEQRIDGLVAPLIGLLEKAGLGLGPIVHQKHLFKYLHRSIVYRSLIEASPNSPPLICAGIVAAQGTPRMEIWVETTPKHRLKAACCKAIAEKLEALRAQGGQDRAWTAYPPEEQDWGDLDLRAPLEPVFAAANQVEAFEAFFRQGFQDLAASGVVNAIQAACRSAAT